jgi:arginase
MLKFSINNIRCAFGQQKHGVQFGGDVIVNNINRINTLKRHKNRVLMNQVQVNTLSDYRTGYNLIRHNVLSNRVNINLGGDHSISAATIQPLLDHYKNELLVIWIDAHADINTFNSSLTKNMHGMPVSVLTGLMEPWYRVKQNRTLLNTDNLIYIGLRDLDSFEIETINNRKIASYAKYDINVTNAIKKHPAKYIHVSCDIDSMNPILMPSTGTPVQNGLTVKHVTSIIKSAKSRLVGLDLVEFNPLIGNKRQVKTTLDNILRILSKIF